MPRLAPTLSAACALAAALLAAAPSRARAQLPGAARDSLLRDDRNFSFYARGPYRPAVPRPERLLGHAVGERHTQYDEQQRVLRAIADGARDRVRVEPFAVTAEGREMRLYIVSAPENIARLDAIRRDLDRLADPRGAAAVELSAVAARTPAVVWFSGSVHGDEVPGFEASMQLLYQLAASDEPATLEALRRTIVVINPSSNPDGHERFAVWSNSVAVGSADPAALEQQRGQPWSVRGRFNHYRFDMNRDVIAATQQEVQGIVRAMLRWHPMVAADLHGYTAQYFFPPAARPVNVNIGPIAGRWLDAIGRGNAAAFDRYGWSYYSRDVFDLYYPGYWDVWPSLTGAVAMTYETDGGPALVKRRDDGTLLSLRDGIAKHFVAAMATTETTAGRAAERVRDYARFRQDAASAAGAGAFRQVVLVPGDDPRRAAELVTALVRTGVEVRRVAQPFTLRNARSYRDPGARAGDRRVAGDAYVVNMAQPQGRVARAVLEPEATLDTAFARGQQARLRRNLQRGRREQAEGYEFYDITAWSLPTAYGVEAYWTSTPVAGGEVVRMADERGAVSVEGAAARRPATGAQRSIEPIAVAVPGGVTGPRPARSAYVFSPVTANSSRLAYHLLEGGHAVAVTGQPIEAGGQQWPRGTFVVRVGRNDSTVHAAVERLAVENGVMVSAVSTAFTGAAQFGTGSEPVVSLVRPSIAVVADEGVSQPAYGAVWWSFERRYGVRFAPVSFAALRDGSLARFNVVIIPDAPPSALAARLGKEGAEALKRWVQAGGTLVTMGGASGWAAREEVALTSSRPVAADTTPAARPAAADSGARRRAVRPAVDSALAALTGIASPTAQRDEPAPVPGANFDVVLDRTHWLTFGYERPRLTVLFEGDTFLKLSREGTNVAVFPATGPLRRAGFVWDDNTERLLRGTALLVDEPLGDGHVVLFANEPMFRGWWRALDKLVMNAVLLGTSF